MNRDKEIYDWLSNKGYDYFTSMKDMKKEDSEELKRILKKYGKDEKSWEDDVYKNNQEFTRYAE
jgi:adenine C2-methylase RlmN of 23S rRNA A2503 and tRNA A37